MLFAMWDVRPSQGKPRKADETQSSHIERNVAATPVTPHCDSVAIRDLYFFG